MARQLSDSLRRLAESQVRLFHAHVEEQLGAEGHLTTPGATTWT